MLYTCCICAASFCNKTQWFQDDFYAFSCIAYFQAINLLYQSIQKGCNHHIFSLKRIIESMVPLKITVQ